VHGRTRCQFYQGRADWRAIARVKAAVSIPVVANGDVGSLADAMAVLDQSGADAVMVGRASYGAPWIPGDIARSAGAEGVADSRPEGPALADYVITHYEDMLVLYGVESGLRQARKHLGWYLDRHARAVCAPLRKAIMTSFDPAEVIRGLGAAFAESHDEGQVRTAA